MTRFHAAVRRPVSDEELTRITAKLQRRVATQRVLVVVMLVFGVPLLAVGPAIFATFTFMASSVTSSWRHWFIVGWFTVVPILFFIDHVTQGKAAERVAEDYGARDGFTRFVTRRSYAAVFLLAVLSTLGPGLVMGAFRRIRADVVHAKTPVKRCAQVVAHLLRCDGGVDVFDLQAQGEQFEDLLSVIECLVQYDWVGVGQGGQRVWVLTDARQVLEGA